MFKASLYKKGDKLLSKYYLCLFDLILFLWKQNNKKNFSDY